MDVVVASRAAHRICSNRHAFEHGVRVVAHEVAILERAGLPLIRVADQVFFALVLLRHEAPFEAGRKTRAATASQRRFLHFSHDLVRWNFFAQYPFERLVPAALDVVGEPPITPRQTGHQDSVGTVVKKFGGRVHLAIAALVASSSKSASSLSACISHSIRLLLTRTTGASPQAPKHSPCFSVKRPSALVSLKSMPSLRLRCAAAAVAPCSAHGKLVQIVSLKRPVGSMLYIV